MRFHQHGSDPSPDIHISCANWLHSLGSLVRFILNETNKPATVTRHMNGNRETLQFADLKPYLLWLNWQLTFLALVSLPVCVVPPLNATQCSPRQDFAKSFSDCVTSDPGQNEQ